MVLVPLIRKVREEKKGGGALSNIILCVHALVPTSIPDFFPHVRGGLGMRPYLAKEGYTYLAIFVTCSSGWILATSYM